MEVFILVCTLWGVMAGMLAHVGHINSGLKEEISPETQLHCLGAAVATGLIHGLLAPLSILNFIFAFIGWPSVFTLLQYDKQKLKYQFVFEICKK